MPTELVFHPHAKINIGLFIKGKRPDGYHELETVFYPAPLQDKLEIKTNTSFTKNTLHVEGIALTDSPEKNLCIRAWKLLKEIFPSLPFVEIYLHKHIPVGAGLGGGSSDAAHTLLGLRTMFDLNISDKKLSNLAVQLGADVPFFLRNKPCFASGIGEKLEELELHIPYEIRLVTSPVFSDTTLAYKELDLKKCSTEKDLRNLIQKPIETWKGCISNDFETSIFARFPELLELKNKLYAEGAIYASMSGSGSALYGFFK